MRSKTAMSALRLTAALLLPSVVASAQTHNRITFEEGEDGWMMLFHGSSLDGWVVAGDADWHVEDGAIVVESGDKSLLHTVDRYTDFELKADFLAAPGTNSGIFLRTKPVPESFETDFYELNIAPPDNAFPTGSFVARQKVAGIPESDEWRTYHVVATGGHFEVSLDGERILEYDDPQPIEEGYLALQHNEGRVAFRNIKVRWLD